MKRTMNTTIDKIYRLIKKEKVVDVVKFCSLLDLSPSTFYNYRKFLESRYVNISYEDGSFKWLEVEEK